MPKRQHDPSLCGRGAAGVASPASLRRAIVTLIACLWHMYVRYRASRHAVCAGLIYQRGRRPVLSVSITNHRACITECRIQLKLLGARSAIVPPPPYAGRHEDVIVLGSHSHYYDGLELHHLSQELPDVLVCSVSLYWRDEMGQTGFEQSHYLLDLANDRLQEVRSEADLSAHRSRLLSRS